MPVIVRVNRRPPEGIPTNLMPRGDGSFYLYLNRLMLKAANSCVGDRVDVLLTYDSTYRAGPSHVMPESFVRALDANSEAKSGWKVLPPSGKKEILRYFAALKTSAALERNVEKAVGVLSGTQGRFMARDWNNPRKK